MSRDITVEPRVGIHPRPTHDEADQGRPRGVGLIGAAGSTSQGPSAWGAAARWRRCGPGSGRKAGGQGSACAGGVTWSRINAWLLGHALPYSVTIVTRTVYWLPRCG